MPLTAELESKKKVALESLREAGSVLVSLSGGVDSAVLLALAIEALGRDRVLAVTGRSASLASDELADAEEVCRFLGARHEAVETREMERPEYRANTGDRCYHCRSEMFEVFRRVARERGLVSVAYGAIHDDTGEFRPGMVAAEEQQVLAPLLDARLTKEEVRDLARDAGLPVRDKPASACLSSRIPVGTEVTAERLAQVDRAEAALRHLGFGQLRVRHHGDLARLELDSTGNSRLSEPGVRARVVEVVRSAGFRFVTVDLEGYRTGSLDPEDPGEVYRILPARETGQ